jgi:hypothetical protein
MNLYRVLRILGVLGAAWIVVGLAVGYMHLREQITEVQLSPASQEADIWRVFVIGAIPYGIIAAILFLPYRKLPQSIRMLCVSLLCLAGGHVIWVFLRPFIGLSGVHLDAVPPASWLSIGGFIALVVTQVAAIVWMAAKNVRVLVR